MVTNKQETRIRYCDRLKQNKLNVDTLTAASSTREGFILTYTYYEYSRHGLFQAVRAGYNITIRVPLVYAKETEIDG